MLNFVSTVNPQVRNRQSVHPKAFSIAVWIVFHRNLPNYWHPVSIQHHLPPFLVAPVAGKKEIHRWHSLLVSLTTFPKTMTVLWPAPFPLIRRMPLRSVHPSTTHPSLMSTMINNHKLGKSIETETLSLQRVFTTIIETKLQKKLPETKLQVILTADCRRFIYFPYCSFSIVNESNILLFILGH